MKYYELKTKRLILRRMDPQFYKNVFGTMETKDQIKALGLSTIEELETERRKYEEGLWTHNKKFVPFLMILKDDGRVVGACGFHTWYVDHRKAEIGYALFQDMEKGKGYMKEALVAILEYGFNTMDLNRVEAFVGEDNVPSIKLMNHFGFRREGLLRQHYFWKGEMQDSIAYGLLKQEYKK